ncbi:MAG: chemotaxis protein CheW, partial [Phycisphaerae bacterium]
MMEITSVPRMPAYIKGVLNLRGKVIPVIDLRLKFGMPEAEHTSETCVIVVDVEGIEMGLIVDKVSEVQDIAGSSIEDAPSFGGGIDTEFILGMGKMEQRVIILLAIEKILSSDTETVAGVAGEPEETAA